MYLKTISIKDVGPCAKTSFDLPFDDAGLPKPVVLVGKNGSGKTILMAHVVDALHEFAAKFFEDVLPKAGQSHAFFKVSGVVNRHPEAATSFCFLEFRSADGVSLQYLDKCGDLTSEELEQHLGRKIAFNPKQMREGKMSSQWDGFEAVFGSGIFAFFPAGRSETPHWLNSENPNVVAKFGMKRRFRGYLEKPIVVSSSAEENKQWLLDVLLDTKLYGQTEIWNAINSIVREIIQIPNARLGVGTRKSGNRLGVADDSTGRLIIPSLDHLSSGQSTLLNICLTILRYCDRGEPIDPKEFTGIVLVDEIDTHLHTSLLHSALPRMVKACPKIQWILSTHSPVFLFGMEKVLGDDGFKIVEMPAGNQIKARDFQEFKDVVAALDIVSTAAAASKELVVFVEGDTDKAILEEAWSKLRPGQEKHFELVVAFDCFAIQNAFSRGTIFTNSPSRSFVGILDFDSAYECFARLADKTKDWKDLCTDESEGRSIKHQKQNGLIFLLPIPEHRKDLAGQKFGKHSGLSIELLFPDSVVNDFVRIQELPGGGRRPVFQDDKKSQFAGSVQNLNAGDFANFEPILKMLESLKTS